MIMIKVRVTLALSCRNLVNTVGCSVHASSETQYLEAYTYRDVTLSPRRENFCNLKFIPALFDLSIISHNNSLNT